MGGFRDRLPAQFPNQLPNYPITQLPDSRLASSVGRSARLELHFEARGGRTILARAYAEPPFRIGHTFDVDGAAYVILVCASPGVFAGDRFDQWVTVGPGARVLLASQSALQVHPASGETPATMHAEFQVADNGELHCLWDPVIPFADARFVQRFDIRLAPASRFYWSDALMSGRASRGESWRFASLDHELRLAVGETLSYLERYVLAPEDRESSQPARSERRPASHRWMAGAAQYIGTMLVHHAGVTAELAQQLHGDLAGSEDLTAAVDVVEPRLMVGRLLGASGTGFSRARAAFRQTVLEVVFGTPRLVARR